MPREKCVVTQYYEAMNEADRELFRMLIQEHSGYTGGKLADILNRAAKGAYIIDRAAVDHFRRKLRIGKATL